MTLVEAFDGLKQWALLYVKHRDINVKKIADIKDTDYGFLVANNDGTATSCVIQVLLGDINRGFIQATAAADKKSVLIVTLSNDDNIRAAYRMWEVIAANPGLLIVFVNPFSSQEEKWVLKPFLHNKVCDRTSLLQGLKAMAELVEPIDAETMAMKIKQKGL